VSEFSCLHVCICMSVTLRLYLNTVCVCLPRLHVYIYNLQVYNHMYVQVYVWVGGCLSVCMYMYLYYCASSGGDLAPSLGGRKFFSRTKISELRFFRKKFPFSWAVTPPHILGGTSPQSPLGLRPWRAHAYSLDGTLPL